VRKSIQALSKEELDQLVRAWIGIQELPPDDRRSFSKIGGYHGEPFRGAGWGSADYWGGYCNHGNVLFPTWHRAYLLELENALRSIDGCADVTLPYWDEVGEDSLHHGVPSLFTDEWYIFGNGFRARNPLYSYTLRRNIVDHRAVKPDANYSKPAGYRTVRYPLSGLVGTEEDREETRKHNEPYLENPATATELLNRNVVTWLTSHPVIDGKPVNRLGLVRQQYADCLRTPHYTIFSNTTSRTEWNDNNPPAVALESPHNAIHLAVGGFDVPGADYSPIPGANGDMGENETASFDPIFYFHHCFIDLVFWQWQQLWQATDKLEVFPEYPGTNSVDSQGPTPGVAPNSWLGEDSPLDPFRKADGSPYTPRDCVDIRELGYDYENTSLDELVREVEAAGTAGSSTTIHVSGIDRTRIRGSFVIAAFVNVGGERQLIGAEAVLSRWHVEGCANCQNHLLSSATFPVPDVLLDDNGLLADRSHTLEVGISTHAEPAVEHLLALTPAGPDGVLRTALTYTADGGEVDSPFHAELRTAR
jgi:tyrosinase